MMSEKEKDPKFLSLMLDGIRSPARRKGIETIMRRRKVSFRQAQRIQARKIVESYEQKKEK